jgi:hypothetical protein
MVQLVRGCIKKVAPEGEQAYQKQKKIEEEDKKKFFEQLVKDRRNNG